MYKYTGDYYGRAMVGDYYSGDPGIGGFLKGAFGVAKRLAGKAPFVGTALTVGGLAKRALIRPSPALARTVAGTALAVPILRAATMNGAPAGQVPRGGFKGRLQRFLPGGATGFVKRRTMNHLNPKALTRAMRRVEGFRQKATRALRLQGFVIKRAGGGGGGKSRVPRRCT